MNTSALIQQQSRVSSRGLIVFTIMMLAILEVLDSTIVNVSLPAMMASLGATQNQITWVLTSYVVASAIVLPLTGFLTNNIGRKKFLLICASGFMISSFLCGAAQTLSQIVIFRIFQGMFGSSLIPISQAILRSIYPLEEQGKAMSIWALGIMAAPICGPTLGGFITEHASWRWVFYINLPFCIIGIFMVLLTISETKIIKQKIDWLGLILMVAGVACLQLMLDQGNNKDWFSSNLILLLTIISGICIIAFMIHSLSHKKPLIKLALYKDKNFRVSCFLLLMFSGVMFGFITLLPIMLENLYGYSAIQAGWVMAPLGLASATFMPIAAMLMKKYHIKFILFISLVISAIGAYCFTLINTDTDVSRFYIYGAVLGAGMGGFMVPLATYALATIPKPDITEASGLFSYARMLGTSIGISILSTFVSRLSQVTWHSISSHITHFNKQLPFWLHHQHLSTFDGVAVARLSQEIAKQSSMLAFLDSFKLIAITFVLLIPFVFLLKTVEMKSQQTESH